MKLLEKENNNDVNDIYFNDFETMYYMFYNNEDLDEEDEYVDLMIRFTEFLSLRINLSYEFSIARREKMSPKYIMKYIINDNLRYVKELEEIVTKLENKKHFTYADSMLLKDSRKKIEEYKKVPYRDFIYNYNKSIKKIEHEQKKLINILYDKIVDEGVYLLDENKREENLKLIKIYYKILCDDDKFKEFWNTLECGYTKDEELNYLFSTVDRIRIMNLSNVKDLELLLNMYILCESIYDIDLEKLESLFYPDDLDYLYETVLDNTINNMENLKLKHGFIYAEVIKKLKEQK